MSGRSTRLSARRRSPSRGSAPKPPMTLVRGSDSHAARGRARPLARFPPSRAAARLQAVEALARPAGGARCGATSRPFPARQGLPLRLGRSTPRAALVTSANLTARRAAVATSSSGVVDYNPRCKPARRLRWFDALWERRSDHSSDELRDPAVPGRRYGRSADGVPAGPARAVRRRGATVSRTHETADGVQLAPLSARRLRARATHPRSATAASIYADGVGTGKTEIGLAFIEEVALEQGRLRARHLPRAATRKLGEAHRRWRVCPPQVICVSTSWPQDEQLAPRRRRRSADAAQPTKDAYRLVVVDEAHALRNEDTTWYRSDGAPARRRAQGRRAADGDAGQQRALGPLQPRDAVRAPRPRVQRRSASPSVRELFVARGRQRARPGEPRPRPARSRSRTPSSVRRDRAFIQQRYPGEAFADGTPVRFPRATPETAPLRPRRRTSGPRATRSWSEIDALDDGALHGRRAWLADPMDASAESTARRTASSRSCSKRFESSWKACLATVERMIHAHDAFAAGWERGVVLSREALRRRGARSRSDEAGISAWVAADRSAEDDDARPVRDFRSGVSARQSLADRDRLVAIRDRARPRSTPTTDPKLGLLRRAARGIARREGRRVRDLRRRRSSTSTRTCPRSSAAASA